MERPIIICLIGESGSGKTTIAEYIESKYGIKSIQSYTDRPRRYPEETGHTFISRDEFDLLQRGDMIAYTTFGENRYCCLKSDVEKCNIYVIDEFGYNYLINNFGDVYKIIGVRVDCPLDIRKLRVDEDRIKRDLDMFKKPDEEYDYIIKNYYLGQNGLKQLFENVDKLISWVWNV